ncbi:hypothetical protein POTOM_034733 [Populus tomentosa]|uniref:Uncharacterized protein n=1 Tax=Populus tomentosa TaxID=118781 RepID=A0A8X7Z7L9_POPTO|nr:hypothetical protein POTOM_034733 [Populus tomentosa]
MYVDSNIKYNIDTPLPISGDGEGSLILDDFEGDKTEFGGQKKMIILLMIRAWAWLLLDFRWAFNYLDFTFPNIVGGRRRVALKTKGFACLMIDLCLQAFGNVYLAASGGGPFMEWDLRPELKWFSNSLVCVKFMEWYGNGTVPCMNGLGINIVMSCCKCNNEKLVDSLNFDLGGIVWSYMIRKRVTTDINEKALLQSLLATLLLPWETNLWWLLGNSSVQGINALSEIANEETMNWFKRHPKCVVNNSVGACVYDRERVVKHMVDWESGSLLWDTVSRIKLQSGHCARRDKKERNSRWLHHGLVTRVFLYAYNSTGAKCLCLNNVL